MGMLGGVGHVWQGIVRQELACLRKFGALGVQKLLEGGKFALNFEAGSLDFGKGGVDSKVDMYVEF